MGGSATVTTGVALLANYLTGSKIQAEHLIQIASLMEQDLGISITGTQEQSNVVFGGVVDYLWTPLRGYGSSVRTTLLQPADYNELESRIALYFTEERSSTDVNTIWCEKLQTEEGYKLHRKKCGLAYEFRGALRQKNWEAATASIKRYQELRTLLCPAYMSAGCWEIEEACREYRGVSFPLGAGGGGTVMVYSSDPEALQKINSKIKHSRIDFKILQRGHKTKNLEPFLET